MNLAAAASLARLARQRRSLSKSRVPLIGFVGHLGERNTGDDVMYEQYAEILAPCLLVPLTCAFEERRLTVLSLAGHRFFAAGLLGGGTLINPHWLDAVQSAVALGIPLWSIGTGVGSAGFEVAPRTSIAGWPAVLRHFRYIGVRGPLSAARLSAVSINAEHLGDGALAILRAAPVLGNGRGRAVTFNLGGSAASVVDGVDYDHIYRDVRAVAEDLRRDGYDIRLVAMTDDDMGPLTRWLGDLARSPISQPRDSASTLGAFAGTHMSVVVRLHAAVFSWCARVPAVHLSYRDKGLDFGRSIGTENLIVDMQHYRREQFDSCVSRVLATGPMLAARAHLVAEARGRKVTARLLELRAYALARHSATRYSGRPARCRRPRIR